MTLVATATPFPRPIASKEHFPEESADRRGQPSPTAVRARLRAASRAAILGCVLHAGAVQGASLAVVAGASADARIGGVAWKWNAPDALHESPADRLTWGIEADVMNVHATHDGPDGAANIVAIGVTPSLRTEWSHGDLVPYTAIGIGAHLVSHTQLRGGPTLSTAFQFGEWLEAGWRFGARRAFEVGLRIEHMSNASIKEPNDGLTFGALRFGWHY